MTYLIKVTYLLLPVIFLLQSCTLSPTYFKIGQSVVTGIVGSPHENLSVAEIDDINFSFIQARIGRGKPVIMILESYSDKGYRWVSGYNEAIETDLSGRVLRTSGLPHNVNVISDNQGLIFNSLQYPYTRISSIDFDEPQLSNLFLRSIFLNRGETEKCFLFETKGSKCIEIVEKFDAESIGWRGDNTYLLDPISYDIVASVTSIHPFLPKLTIRFYL